MMYGYGNSLGYGMGLWGGLFGGIFMLIFWIVIIWLVIMLVRGRFHDAGGEQDAYKKDLAMDALRERFAKGEITKEEFEEKSQILKK